MTNVVELPSDPFPRLKDRGLIEASPYNSAKTFAALFPRLKDRGLIEAVPAA